MVFESNTPTIPQELAYDLRQIYAKIVGEHLIDVAESRKADNFYVWYKSLEDLHTIVKHKFTKDKDEEEYNRIRDKVTGLANKHPQAWLGTSKDPVQRGSIEESLRQLEEFLYKKMNDAKMFGDTWRTPGL
jgi:hypothetical protein